MVHHTQAVRSDVRIAAIDQGTSSTRVLRLSSIDAPELVHCIEHQQHFSLQGWVEHDALELLGNIRQCIERVGDIDFLGISNQGESCLAWDAISREPLSPVIVWQDNRTHERIEQLKASGSQKLTLALAGLPLDSYFSASKLAWLLDNAPAVRQARKSGRLRLGTTDAYFLDCLTGQYITDITTASRTSLMNLEKGMWDEELCALFGVPLELLPQIVPSTGDHFGACQTSVGRRPIVASIVDQQAALYGFGCRDSGDLKFTFGTGGFALAVTGARICRQPVSGLLPTIAWQKAGEQPVYAVDGGIYTASASLKWAQGLGLFEEYRQINQFSKASAIDRGLVFVPALSGLACPHWDRQAKGAWLGLGMATESQDMVQAIVESVAFRAVEIIDAMEECFDVPGAINIDGGLSKNPYFVQFLADVLGREVRPAHYPEMTALGVAALVADAVAVLLPAGPEFRVCTPGENRPERIQRFRKALEIARQWRFETD